MNDIVKHIILPLRREIINSEILLELREKLEKVSLKIKMGYHKYNHYCKNVDCDCAYDSSEEYKDV